MTSQAFFRSSLTEPFIYQAVTSNIRNILINDELCMVVFTSGVFILHFFWEQQSTWCSFCLSFWIFSWVFPKSCLSFSLDCLSFPRKSIYLCKYWRESAIFCLLGAIFPLFLQLWVKNTQKIAFNCFKNVEVFLKNCHVLKISRSLRFLKK